MGEGIAKSGVSRDEIWITSKVGFFPVDSDGVWMHNPNNVKGDEGASAELACKQLGVEKVDLLLLHNPITSRAEYNASCLPHFFELFGTQGNPLAITPAALPDGEQIRPLIMKQRREEAARARDAKLAYERRKASWLALEKAQAEGKCRYIGVSNYPAELLLEMRGYASVMPACNQLELHPWFDHARLRTLCAEMGMVLAAYGTGFATRIEKSEVVEKIAKRLNRSAVCVVVRWTIQSGVVAIPKAEARKHQAENLLAYDFELSEDDMAAIGGLNKDHPFYWCPKPTLDTLEGAGLPSVVLQPLQAGLGALGDAMKQVCASPRGGKKEAEA